MICITQFFTVILYERQPDLNVTQYLFLRSAIGLVISLLLVNVNFYEVMYSSIPSDCVWNLVFRVVQAIVMMYCLFASIYYIPLVMVAMTRNTAPFITSVLSYLILKEKIQMIDVVILIISFSGVALLIQGAVQPEGGSTSRA